MRLWLDPYKLATRDLTASDVISAIQNQNVQVAAGQVGQQPVPAGQPLQLPMSALGRLDTEKQFGDIILKTGNTVRTSPIRGRLRARRRPGRAGRPELRPNQHSSTANRPRDWRSFCSRVPTRSTWRKPSKTG